jgi:hypothetical protein
MLMCVRCEVVVRGGCHLRDEGSWPRGSKTSNRRPGRMARSAARSVVVTRISVARCRSEGQPTTAAGCPGLRPACRTRPIRHSGFQR